MKPMRLALPVALAVALSACSLGGLLGGGKVPPTLLTLTPQAALQGDMTRSASAGQAVTIAVPIVPKELRSVRVPVQVSYMDVAYVEKLQWIDPPTGCSRAFSRKRFGEPPGGWCSIRTRRRSTPE